MLLGQLSRLEEAVARDGCYTLGDVLDEIQEGRAQLWEAPGAVIITQVHTYPRAKVLHMWLAAGDLEQVVELSNRAMEWGHEIGCTRATLAGRRGWERVLAAEGWERELTLMGRKMG